MVLSAQPAAARMLGDPGEPRTVHVGEPVRDLHDLRSLQAFFFNAVQRVVTEALVARRDRQRHCPGQRRDEQNPLHSIPPGPLSIPPDHGPKGSDIGGFVSRVIRKICGFYPWKSVVLITSFSGEWPFL
jgi:hypothetical protein